MTADSDRYQIVIPFINTTSGSFEQASVSDVNSNTEFNVSSGISGELLTGDEAELEITTADRATRNAFIQVPDTIEDDESEVTL